MIMDGTLDAVMLEDINPLQEFSYISTETGEQKTLRCIFAPVDQGGGEIFVMGTIQDISAETALKKQLAEEESRRQEEMHNLFELMQADQKAFGNFIEDTNFEFDRINEMLKDKSISNRRMLINLYQSVHSIKSNAVIIGLSTYGEKLHALESKIKLIRDKEKEPEFDDILHVSLELEQRIQDKEKLEEIIRRVMDFNSSGGVGSMREEEVFMQTLKRACEKVAEDEHKKVIFTVKELDREALNKGHRRAIQEILIQMVRNAVYHGIESPEERLALGKEEAGTISLSVKTEGGAIRIVLEDDGRGLDFERIAEKAEEQGLLKNPADKADVEFLTRIIFSPGFSTSETENMHAGRGIGLNLVKDRLEELKGSLRIHSKKGLRLAYDMKIPLKAEKD
jgi:two-component system chemotaxis sensor kinase CheA